jgi:predicted GNAT family acetyltransferase
MKIQLYNDINEFYDLVFPFLVKREAENNLLFSILNTIKVDPYRYGDEKPVLITVAENNKVSLVSLRTPPYNQIISYTTNLESIKKLAKELLLRNEEIPGFLGFKEGADIFIKLWCESKDVKPQLIRNEKIYKLESVAPETLGDKEFIMGTESNQNLILKWAREFVLEALPETDEFKLKRSEKALIEDIKEGRIFLLLDRDDVVSMARKAGKTPNGNLVNYVYTPPNLRRRGYATECVAKLSKYILEEGNKYCFLFTDLMNPTSNKIYQKIGYRPIINIDEYLFIKE